MSSSLTVSVPSDSLYPAILRELTVRPNPPLGPVPSTQQVWAALDDMKLQVFGVIADRRAFKPLVESFMEKGNVNLDRFGKDWEIRVRQLVSCIQEGERGIPPPPKNMLGSSGVSGSVRSGERFLLQVQVKDFEFTGLDRHFSVFIDNEEVIPDISYEQFERPFQQTLFFMSKHTNSNDWNHMVVVKERGARVVLETQVNVGSGKSVLQVKDFQKDRLFILEFMKERAVC